MTDTPDTPDISPKCEYPIIVITPKGREAKMECGRTATQTINFNDKERWCVCKQHYDHIVQLDKKLAKTQKAARTILTEQDKSRIIAAEEKRERKKQKRRAGH